MKHILLITLVLIMPLFFASSAQAIGYIGPPVSNTVKGLAMVDWGHPEDLATLNVSMFYGWGEYCTTNPRCINMVREWQLPQHCYTQLLVGNEPNSIEPWGSPKTPWAAATAVRAIERQCPNTVLIVGNVFLGDWSPPGGGWGTGYNWIQQFKAAYRMQSGGYDFSGVMGVHCYTTDATQACFNLLNSVLQIWHGAWALTEFNVLNGNASQMQEWMTYISTAQFDGVAAYTNRQLGGGYDLPGASLVNADGTLTPVGAVYAAGW